MLLVQLKRYCRKSYSHLAGMTFKTKPILCTVVWARVIFLLLFPFEHFSFEHKQSRTIRNLNDFDQLKLADDLNVPEN